MSTQPRNGAQGLSMVTLTGLEKNYFAPFYDSLTSPRSIDDDAIRY